MIDILEQIVAAAIQKLPDHLRLTILTSSSLYQEEMLEISAGAGTIKMIIEYKSDPRMMHLPFLISRHSDFGPIILAANHISSTIRDELRKLKINYIDLSGNVYLDSAYFFVLIDAQKKVKLKEEYKGRAFTKTGLKVVFAFLSDPDVINLSYRSISEKLSVSLDTVHNVIGGLKELGYILTVTDKRNKLINKESLMMRWVQEYDLKLRPDLFIGTFRFANADLLKTWERIDLTPGQIQWGGEPAGALITKFLRPAEFILYTSMSKIEVMKQLKLIPDPAGNIKLFKKFWFDSINVDKFVPELLVYADLVNHGDSRNQEIAGIIYEQYLQGQLK